MNRPLTAFVFCLALLGSFDHVEALDRPRLKADASEAITGAVLVDEKGLRKLREVVSTRMSQRAAQSRIRYKVTLQNASYYETEDLEQLLQDENLGPRRITSIELLARVAPALVSHTPITSEQQLQLEEQLLEVQAGENPKIEIRIGPAGIYYSITGADRDWVLSTQVDIADRLKTMIARGVLWADAVSGALGVVVSGSVWILIVLAYRRRHHKVRRRDDPGFKGVPFLTYMTNYNDPALTSNNTGLALFVSVLSGFAIGALVRYSGNYLFPNCVFLLGAEVERYSDLLATRHFLLTSVVVTLVVGILSTVISNLVTRGGRR